MLSFVNAKINIGLQIVNRRPDGYHDLQTIFYPVGVFAGRPDNPAVFCDTIEILPSDAPDEITLTMLGNPVDCPLERNLVWRAARLFFDSGVPENFRVSIIVDKHLPDGAGLGGGSADASFTLLTLRQVAEEFANQRGLSWEPPSYSQLSDMALKLGADCPFFIYNRPAYAEGIGERLQPLLLNLAGYWLIVAKPFSYVSTREAFSGIKASPASFDLRTLPEIPVSEWKYFVENDFEKSIFPAFPEIRLIKAAIYESGALYASLTGSGACVYGIYPDKDSAEKALADLSMIPTIKALSLLKL